VRAIALLNLGGGALARGASAPVEVEAALREAGIDASVREIPSGRLSSAAREAAAAGVDLVIAGGGDGTVGTVAGALAGSDAVLGVLPLGTFNHFARDLGMPPDLKEAARALATAQTCALDLGEVNGHRFVNNSALGFYPEVVKERAEPRIRTRLRKALVSLAAAARVVGHYRLSRVTLEVEGERVSTRTPFVFVSNNPAEMQLFRFGHRDRLDGGKLFVYVHHGTSHLAVLHTIFAAIFKDIRAAGRFDQWSTDAVEVEYRHRRPVPVFLDGELLYLQPPLAYRILAGRLRVAVPQAVAEAAYGSGGSVTATAADGDRAATTATTPTTVSRLPSSASGVTRSPSSDTPSAMATKTAS
jgi:diacylglycerol kinase family enzyme